MSMEYCSICEEKLSSTNSHTCLGKPNTCDKVHKIKPWMKMCFCGQRTASEMYSELQRACGHCGMVNCDGKCDGSKKGSTAKKKANKKAYPLSFGDALNLIMSNPHAVVKRKLVVDEGEDDVEGFLKFVDGHLLIAFKYEGPWTRVRAVSNTELNARYAEVRYPKSLKLRYELHDTNDDFHIALSRSKHFKDFQGTIQVTIEEIL